MLDLALVVLEVRLDERVRINPEEFRDRGVLQHHRLGHVERRGAMMRERRTDTRGEADNQYHQHQ